MAASPYLRRRLVVVSTAIVIAGLVALPSIRSELHWWVAVSSRQPESLKEFVACWPRSSHAKSALQRIDELDWECCVDLRRTDAGDGSAALAAELRECERYLAAHPSGANAAAASERVEALSWRQAVDSGTRSPLREFIGRFDRSSHLAEARARVEEMLWESCARRGDAAAFAEYRSEYPEGAHAEEARTQLERLDWAETCSRGTVADFDGYLISHPEGAHARDARRMVDDSHFESASAVPSIVAFSDYLRDFPEGRHRDDASLLLSCLDDPVRTQEALEEVRQFQAAMAAAERLDFETARASLERARATAASTTFVRSLEWHRAAWQANESLVRAAPSVPVGELLADRRGVLLDTLREERMFGAERFKGTDHLSGEHIDAAIEAKSRRSADSSVLPAAEVALLAKNNEWSIRAGVAGSRWVGAEVLATLSRDAEIEVRWQVARSERSPALVLEQLFERERDHDGSSIEVAVLKNRACPQALLERAVARDSHDRLREAAWANLEAPFPELTRSALEKWYGPKALANPACPRPLVVKGFATAQGLESLAANPCCPAPLWSRLLLAGQATGEAAVKLRRALAGNSRCPDEVLGELAAIEGDEVARIRRELLRNVGLAPELRARLRALDPRAALGAELERRCIVRRVVLNELPMRELTAATLPRPSRVLVFQGMADGRVLDHGLDGSNWDLRDPDAAEGSGTLVVALAIGVGRGLARGTWVPRAPDGAVGEIILMDEGMTSCLGYRVSMPRFPGKVAQATFGEGREMVEFGGSRIRSEILGMLGVARDQQMRWVK